MTAQIPDTVVYQHNTYRIVGVKGKGLPTPGEFDMQPVMMSTGCYRGYVTQYALHNDRFVLNALTLRTGDDSYKPINGVRPTIGGTFKAGQYTNLNLPTRFSGGILIAKDFIQAMYVHMGFQKPTSFETVVELLIENGRLKRAIDHSEKVAQLRQALSKPLPKPGFDDQRMRERHTMDWIEWTFSLDYDL